MNNTTIPVFQFLARQQLFHRLLASMAALMTLLAPITHRGTCAMAEQAGTADQPLTIIARAPEGHGMLCQLEDKTILLVSGTPDEMGRAHGTLMAEKAKMLRNSGLCQIELGHDLPSDVWLTLKELLEDPDASRMRKGLGNLGKPLLTEGFRLRNICLSAPRWIWPVHPVSKRNVE